VAGSRGLLAVHQDENRAGLDDGPANGSRLCGRFATLAGMTAAVAGRAGFLFL